jgi:meiotically up-regulated gene 157 (Mug157) protein
MACVELTHLQEILSAMVSKKSAGVFSGSGSWDPSELLQRAAAIAAPVCAALDDLAAAAAHKSDSVLPFEVDGRINQLFMDDANVPSLLSLPVLGYMDKSHPVYSATRHFTLSDSNPFWFSGELVMWCDGVMW